MIGRVVGNYKIIEVLGEGGVGMVYKGVDTMLDREVAIKVLRPELASQTSVVERFRTEAVTLAKLSHPNIATLYSLFRHGNDLFMVLEFIEGETLDRILFRRGAISAEEAIPIFCQALEGINFAHQRGVVHRDIKPGNMILTGDGVLKVLDFGIARLLGSNRMTRVGNVVGTLEYMSPEQVRGLETDARSDVYGLGIMLYEILTGRLPFESENDFELMKMQTEATPRAPRALNPEIPAEIEAAILKAVAKNADERFQTAGEFLDCLLQIALPDAAFGFSTIYNFRRNSRPSNPGLRSGETKRISSDVSPPLENQTAETVFTIPKPEVPITLEIGDEIKKRNVGETRLAPPSNKPVHPGETKGTRLSAAPPTKPVEFRIAGIGAAEIEKFLSENFDRMRASAARLSWIHYAGAGAIIFFLFSLFATAAILPFMWTGGDPKTKDEPQSVRQKSGEPEKAVVAAEPTIQPTVKTEPTPQTVWRQEPVLPPQPTPANTPIVAAPPFEPAPTPVQEQPKERERQREAVKNNPPPAPKKSEPKQVSKPPRQPSEKGRMDRLRDLMTDN
jgi:serine/threonine protein kinase